MMWKFSFMMWKYLLGCGNMGQIRSPTPSFSSTAPSSRCWSSMMTSLLQVIFLASLFFSGFGGGVRIQKQEKENVTFRKLSVKVIAVEMCPQSNWSRTRGNWVNRIFWVTEHSGSFQQMRNPFCQLSSPTFPIFSTTCFVFPAYTVVSRLSMYSLSLSHLNLFCKRLSTCHSHSLSFSFSSPPSVMSYWKHEESVQIKPNHCLNQKQVL